MTAVKKPLAGRCGLSLIILGVLVAGCGRSTPTSPADGRLQVFAGIPPLTYVVEQIGGKHIQVGTLVQPGQDPHTFEPGPQQVLHLSRAVVFFKVGMPFENTIVERVLQANPQMKAVDVGRGVKKLTSVACCSIHSAGEHDHAHSDTDHAHHEEHADEADLTADPHIWLSPPRLKIQAANIAAALIEADPAHAAEYRTNLEQFSKRLDELHQRLTAMLAPYRGRSFIVFHPGFAYLADTYGLKEEAVEFEGRQPTPKQLGNLIDLAKAQGIKTVFLQPQYDPHTVQVLADTIGGKVVVIDGLAKDVMHDINDIATKVAASFAETKPAAKKHP